MTKRTVTLKLSISDKNEPKAEQFFARLQNMVEEASSNGLEVSIISDGAEVAVLEDYDSKIYVPEHEVDPMELPDVKAFIRPTGVCGGVFIYRKDSIALLRMRMRPSPDYVVTPSM